MMENKGKGWQNWSDHPFVVFIIIIAALVGILTSVPSIRAMFYSPASQDTTNQLTIALSDKFDGSAGSYDTNLWDCAHECSIENIFLRDDVLNLQRSNEGYSMIISRSKWKYSDLASLTGKFQISAKSNNGDVGWLSIADDVTGCGFHGAETPYVQCDVGANVDGKREYATIELPIKFDTWYSIKFDFDQNSNAIRFYLDNTLLGEYIPTTYPNTVQVATGVWSPDSGLIYIDDVLLTLSK